MQPCRSAEKALRSVAKAVLKTVGEFLKPCDNQVQVSCPFSRVLGFSYWKAKIVWFCTVRRMQKNVSEKCVPQLGQGIKACRDSGAE
jgi:hypothetical protein